MLIKDDEFAKKVIGKQVIFGMAEPYEAYIFDEPVIQGERAYVVSGVINSECRLDGVAKPWSKLLLDYKDRGTAKSDIYNMFSDLINKVELVSYNNCIFAVSRLTEDSFTIVGANLVAFCNMKSNEIECSGKGDLSLIKGLDINKLAS